MAVKADGSIRIDTKIDTKGADAGLSKLTGSLKRFAAMVGIAFGIAAITSFGAACIDLASDLDEVQNVVDVTFGEGADTINEFAKSAATQFGLSELAAKQYTGTMGAMLKSMGLTTDAASDMSIAIAGLAGDMASFYNLDTDTAFEKIRSGISGETEPLKQLGINMSVANLQAYALSQGITTAYSAMSEQNKALLRYNYLLEVTADAQGDFSRTSNSWANQVRILSLQFDTLKATLGRGLIAALTPALQMLNSLIGQLNAAATAFESFVSAVTGKSQEITTSTAGATVAIEEMSDSITDSSQAAKQASRGLSVFDELNVLSPTESAATADTAGMQAPTVSTEAAAQSSSAIDGISDAAKRLQALLAPLQEINLDGLKQSFENLQQALAPITKALFAGLEWAYLNLFVPLAQWTIEDAAPAFLDALAAAAALLGAALEVLQPLGLWLWDSFLQPLAAWTGETVITALGGITAALTAVSDWISENQELVRGATVTIGAFFTAWKLATLAEFIINAGGIVALITNLTNAIELATIAKLKDKVMTLQLAGLYAKDFALSVAKSTAALIKQAAQWTINTGAMIAGKVAQIAMTAATSAWTVVCGIATAVTTAFGVAVAFLTSPIGLVILAIGAIIAIIVLLVKNWDTVKAVAASVWDWIKNIWGAVAGWFKDKVITPLSKAFAAFRDTVTKIWNAIWGGIKKVINGIIGGVEGFVNAIVKGINLLIGGLNKVLGLAEGIGSALGFNLSVKIPELKTVSIPRLAKGAVIPPNREFLAVLGDQKHGTNIEAPLDTIVEAVKRAFAGMDTSGGGDVYVYIGNEAIDSRIVRVSRQNQIRTNGRFATT